MPELPEVEVIRSGLSELIARKTIEKVNVIQDLIDTAFGDIIDEQTTTIIQDGE